MILLHHKFCYFKIYRCKDERLVSYANGKDKALAPSLLKLLFWRFKSRDVRAVNWVIIEESDDAPSSPIKLHSRSKFRD